MTHGLYAWYFLDPDTAGCKKKKKIPFLDIGKIDFLGKIFMKSFISDREFMEASCLVHKLPV